MLGKLEVLKQIGIETELMVISPIIREGDAIEAIYHPKFPRPESGLFLKNASFYLRYCAMLKNGQELTIQEHAPRSAYVGDEEWGTKPLITFDFLKRARSRLESHAINRAESLKGLSGYNTEVGYTIQERRPSFLRDLGSFVEG